ARPSDQATTRETPWRRRPSYSNQPMRLRLRRGSGSKGRALGARVQREVFREEVRPRSGRAVEDGEGKETAMEEDTVTTDPVTIVVDTSIRPFRVDISQEALDDLRRRITAARLPSRELVDDRSQGV